MTPHRIIVIVALVLAVVAALVGWNLIDSTSSALNWQGLTAGSLAAFYLSLLV